MQAGNFLEHATVYGNSYGILKSEVLGKLRQGKDVLLNVDVQGAATIRERAEEEPELKRALVTVFLTPPSMAMLEERLKKRGTDSAAVIQKRLGVARQEIAQWKNFDYLLISDTHRRRICGGCRRLWRRRKCARRGRWRRNYESQSRKVQTACRAQSTVDSMSKGKNIVLGVTGSIAAHKAADLASLLTKAGLRRARGDDGGRAAVHHAAAVQDAFAQSGGDGSVRRGGRLEADAHRAGGRGGFVADRAGDGEHDCQAGAWHRR